MKTKSEDITFLMNAVKGSRYIDNLIHDHLIIQSVLLALLKWDMFNPYGGPTGDFLYFKKLLERVLQEE